MAKKATKKATKKAKRTPVSTPKSTGANFASYVVHKRLVFELQDYLSRTGKGKALLDLLTGAEAIKVGSREFPGFALTDLPKAQQKSFLTALKAQVKWLTTERRKKRLASLTTAVERLARQQELATA